MKVTKEEVERLAVSAELSSILMKLMQDLKPTPDLNVQRLAACMSFMALCRSGDEKLSLQEMQTYLSRLYSFYVEGMEAAKGSMQ